jgi:hypothetical protein
MADESHSSFFWFGIDAVCGKLLFQLKGFKDDAWLWFLLINEMSWEEDKLTFCEASNLPKSAMFSRWIGCDKM